MFFVQATFDFLTVLARGAGVADGGVGLRKQPDFRRFPWVWECLPASNFYGLSAKRKM